MESAFTAPSPSVLPAALPGRDAPLRLLIVDDDEGFRYLTVRALRSAGNEAFIIEEAASAYEASERVAAGHYDCLLIDNGLPDEDGTHLMSELREQRPNDCGAMILITGEGSEEIVAEAMRAGAHDYLPKRQVSGPALRRAVYNAVHKARLEQSLRDRNVQLEIANHQLERRNEEIARFYHRVSHEIKTPLTAARMFLSILHEGLAGPLTEMQADAVGEAIDSCDQLTRQFNDLIDCTRLETRKFPLQRREESIARLIERSVASIAPARTAKSITITVDIADRLPTLVVDGGRIVQVLVNMLGNAVKFTPEGGSIRVVGRRATEKPDGVEIDIHDTGIGISAEHLPRIFDRLFQAGAEGNDLQGAGLGLGLTIAAELASLHGGNIDVASTLGVGSCFSLYLPVLPIEADPPVQEAA